MAFQNNLIINWGNFLVDTDWHSVMRVLTFTEFPQSWLLNNEQAVTFFESAHVEITPILRATIQFEWMINTLLFTVTVMAILLFALPNRQSYFSRLKQSFKKPNNVPFQKPGFLFPFLFYLNYLVAGALFAILTIERFVKTDSFGLLPAQLITFVVSAFFIYSLYKLLVIAFSGFLFKTRQAASYQVELYVNINSISGFLMLGVLMLGLFTKGDYFFYFGFFIILISNIIKWFQTIIIGKTISQFKLYHLIIYLCTLEIIPLLLLIKLVQNLSV